MRFGAEVSRLKLRYCRPAAGTVETVPYESACTSNNGNIASQWIYPVGRQQRYEYDPLNRLLEAREYAAGGSTALWSEVNGFDRYGNRWVTTAGLETNPLRPSLASNFDVTTNRLAGVSHDLAGNQLGQAPFGLSYDAEGRMVRAEAGAPAPRSEKNEYDGEGRRVKRVVCGGLASGCEAAEPGAVVSYFFYDMQGSWRWRKAGHRRRPGGGMCSRITWGRRG